MSLSNKVKVTFRDHSRIYMERFKTDIISWNASFDLKVDTDEFCEKFCADLDGIYCRTFPLKTKFLSRKRLSKPWLSAALLTSIKNKSKYYKLSRIGHISRNFYARYRNHVTNLTREAKKRYYVQVFESNKKDMRKTWKTLKDLIGSGVGRERTRELLLNGRTVSDESTMAEEFNNYFANLPKELERNIPPAISDPVQNVIGPTLNSFVLFPVTLRELSAIVNGMKNKSYGPNSIPVFVFKQIFPVLSSLVNTLINKSFAEGVFPSKLKKILIIPILKGGTPADISNYRPISILPLFSKLIEKCMCIRMVKFMNKFELFADQQFGFRHGRCTMDAVLKYTEFML